MPDVDAPHEYLVIETSQAEIDGVLREFQPDKILSTDFEDLTEQMWDTLEVHGKVNLEIGKIALHIPDGRLEDFAQLFEGIVGYKSISEKRELIRVAGSSEFCNHLIKSYATVNYTMLRDASRVFKDRNQWLGFILDMAKRGWTHNQAKVALLAFRNGEPLPRYQKASLNACVSDNTDRLVLTGEPIEGLPIGSQVEIIVKWKAQEK